MSSVNQRPFLGLAIIMPERLHLIMSINLQWDYTHTPTHTLQPYVHNQAPTKALIHKEICSGTQFIFRNQIHTLLQVQYPQIHTEVNTSSTHTNIHTIHSVIQVNAHINR